MNVRYEAVFGYQDLFDNAPKDAEFVKGRLLYKLNGGRLFVSNGAFWNESCSAILSQPEAMRRVIKTPQWTWEDKKAGRFPECGCEVIGSTSGNKYEVIYVSSKNVVTRNVVDDTCHANTIHSFMRYHAPIETPEEKAQRLRSEWVKHALDLYMSSPKNDVASMGDVYDALLSGELKAPEVE